MARERVEDSLIATPERSKLVDDDSCCSMMHNKLIMPFIHCSLSENSRKGFDEIRNGRNYKQIRKKHISNCLFKLLGKRDFLGKKVEGRKYQVIESSSNSSGIKRSDFIVLFRYC